MPISAPGLTRPRRPFRAFPLEGPPAEAVVAAPAGLAFGAGADRAATDRDVLFGYQVFLGRNPESSFVISDAKASRVREFLHGMLRSPEFAEAVARPLASGRPLPHGRVGATPGAARKEWLAEILDLPPADAATLAEADGWRALWRVLSALPEYPRAELSDGVAAVAPEAVAAERGFVLIQVDQPKPGERLHPGGTLSGSGWAIAPADIVEVAVRLDGRLLTHARHGLPRPDVARNFPHYRHVESCGFAFSTKLPDDLAVSATSELTISVLTIEGEVGERGVAVASADAVPAEAGETWPIRLQVEDVRIDAAGELRLRGWAVSREVLSRVSVFLGAEALGVAELGLARPDIAELHPGYPNAVRSGLVFAASLGRQPLGVASLRVQATDALGRQRQVIVPVMFHSGLGASASLAGAGSGAAGMRLELDRPVVEDDQAIDPVRGACQIAGWAVAPAGLASVQVFCDEALVGEAYLGIRREDIARAFPEHQGSLLAGWALVLPPGAVLPGERNFRIEARSRDGAVTDLRFTWRVQAADAVLPGAAIRRRTSRAEAAFGLRLLAARGGVPAFLVVVRAARANAAALALTLGSLARQVLPGWRAVVVGFDCSFVLEPELTGQVGFAADFDAAEVAPDGLVCVLRAGDELGCDALLELAIALAMRPDCGLAYADELQPDAASGRAAPFFKPDWSGELLLGMNYIGRAAAVRGAAVRKAGLGDGDWDAALRWSEAVAAVHVPGVLLARGAAADMPEAERTALMAALRRRGVVGEVRKLDLPGTWRVARADIAASVSIVMPTCGAGDFVQRAIPSMRASAGRDVEIVVLDNVPASGRKLKTWLRKHADRVVNLPGAFNWSRFNNVGAAAASGEILLFLNDDIEALEAGWLDAVVEQVKRPEVGVVGAKLLYPDGKVQHAGQCLADGHARHSFRFAGAGDAGPFGMAQVAREVASVTGACLAVRRDLFDALGRFDEAHSVVNNDLDFCLRAREAGYSVIVTPHAVLRHHELASRAGIEDAYDASRFTGAWRLRFLRGDPYQGTRLSGDSDHWTPEPEPVMSVYAGPEGPAIADVGRILAVKLDHIGDYLTALPALRGIKQRFPAAHLTLLAPPATAALARGEVAIDEVMEFTFFHARSGRGQLGVSEGEFEALGLRLGEKRFDMAIDLRMQPETRRVLQVSGAPFLVGYDQGGRFPWLSVALEWEGDTRLLAKRQHVSERLLQLVAAAEAACENLTAAVPVPALPAAAVPALAALPADFLARPLVCVHPGVGNPVRQWPARYFGELIDLLAGCAGLHAVIVGGADEQGIADEVLAQVRAQDAVVSLVGRLKLPELAQVMRACRLFVGNNSGPKHLAASLGVPTLGVHSAVVDAVEWGPLGAAAFAIRRQMVCAPCYLEFASDCPRGMACLTGLRPRDAFAACVRLLGMGYGAAAPDFRAKELRHGRGGTRGKRAV